jgi:hypothetical protein
MSRVQVEGPHGLVRAFHPPFGVKAVFSDIEIQGLLFCFEPVSEAVFGGPFIQLSISIENAVISKVLYEGSRVLGPVLGIGAIQSVEGWGGKSGWLAVEELIDVKVKE